MRLTLAAIGKLREGPEKQLFTQYAARLPWKIELKEIEAKKHLPAPRRVEEECRLLREAAAGAQRIVLLDERGEMLTSQAFAEKIKRWQVDGDSQIAFIIGGADGVTEALRKTAHLVLSFGRVSWPHLLARALLAEQLYRAHTLIAGHPYHRE